MEAYTKLFSKAAAERGITKLHFHIEEAEKRDVSVLNGAVRNISTSGETLVLIEGEYDGFIGSAYSEDLDDKNIATLIDNIIQTASLNKQPYAERPIHTLPMLEQNHTPFEAQKIAGELLDAENAARGNVSNIQAFRISLSHIKKTITLANDRGERMSDAVNFFSLNTYIMVKDGAQAQTARYHELFNNKTPDFKEVAVSAAREAFLMLNSNPCASGKYMAVIRNNAFAELFGAFLPAFYAEKCQSKMSFLMGKANSDIGSSAFSAYEAPDRIISRRFDDEGTLTATKTLIANGKLLNYFHNNHTAAIDKQKSNGNGFRQNYNEGISSAYTNTVVESGDKSLDTLLSEMGDGILITACDGIFAGVNPVSGDFSVISKGYMIRGGQIAEPVSGITIGGNLYDILSATQERGNDSITIYGNTGVVTSPSILLSEIVISG